MVLKIAGQIQKELSAMKFAHKWEEPYVIRKPTIISKPDSENLLCPNNAKWLKCIILKAQSEIFM